MKNRILAKRQKVVPGGVWLCLLHRRLQRARRNSSAMHLRVNILQGSGVKKIRGKPHELGYLAGGGERSSYLSPRGQPYWINVRFGVGWRRSLGRFTPRCQLDVWPRPMGRLITGQEPAGRERGGGGTLGLTCKRAQHGGLLIGYLCLHCWLPNPMKWLVGAEMVWRSPRLMATCALSVCLSVCLSKWGLVGEMRRGVRR